MLEKLFQKTYDSELDGFRLTYSKRSSYISKRYGGVYPNSMPQYLKSIK
jgi:hypothetical protein